MDPIESYKIELDDLAFDIDITELDKRVKHLGECVNSTNIENEITNYLNIVELEKLTNCCAKIAKRENTTQIPYRKMFPVLHEKNPFLNVDRISNVHTIWADQYTTSEERRKKLKNALLFTDGASNEYNYRILAVEKYMESIDALTPQLQEYIDMLRKVLKIFSRYSKQRGCNYNKGYRTFQEIQCISTQMDDYINTSSIYKFPIKGLRAMFSDQQI